MFSKIISYFKGYPKFRVTKENLHNDWSERICPYVLRRRNSIIGSWVYVNSFKDPNEAIKMADFFKERSKYSDKKEIIYYT